MSTSRATSDSGGGYDVGWVFAGEWLNYTVTVASAGTYDLEFRVASAGAGGTFHLEVNGVNKTGGLTVPNTGGWQTWTTIRKTSVTLGAGQQVWRLVMDTNGASTAVGNFNYFRATGSSSTPYGGVATSLPGTLEAENFDEGGSGISYVDTTPENSGGQYRSTAVDIEPTADSGSGYDVGWVFAGEWLKYSVNVASAGAYDLEFRVASAGAGGTFHLEVNGADVTGPLVAPNTGGWQTWTTLRKTRRGADRWTPDVASRHGRRTGRRAPSRTSITSAQQPEAAVLRMAGRRSRCQAPFKPKTLTRERPASRTSTTRRRTPEDSIAQPVSMSSRRATAAVVTTSVGRSRASGSTIP